MYYVYDTHTNEIVGTYPTCKRAHSRADALDNKYGAVRYSVRYTPSTL